jgi:uncharacterized membrane protein YdbT with pleckstrin-like domain
MRHSQPCYNTAMNPNQPAPTVNNPLNAMGEREVNIFEVKRHPIGLLGMYISFGLLLVVVAAVAVIAPDILTDYDSAQIQKIGIAAFLVSAVFVGIFSVIAHVVYYGNRWVLTSDSLTQVTQPSLFNTQHSQLSLGNLEDVTAQQEGILAHMFNYGVLKVETAGEHSKFSFAYCPNPNAYAQKILVAREAFEQGEHYGSPAAPSQPTPTA